MNLLGVKLERVLGELETLLHEGSKLTDTATLLAQNFLGVGGTDDNLSLFKRMLALASTEEVKEMQCTSVRA